MYRSNKPRNSQHISTMVTPELKDALLAIAEKRGVSYGVIVREALRQWLEVTQHTVIEKTPQETS